MRTVAIITVAALCVFTSTNATNSVSGKSPPAPTVQPAPDLRGTESAPLVVTVAPSAEVATDRAEAKEEQRMQAKNEARIVRATDFIAVGTLILAAATMLLWIYTYRLWKTSSTAARASDKAARDQLEQVTRSASAMENVALHTQKNATLFQQLLAKQARAYVAVLVNGALYQESGKGLKFEARATITNSGMTPAHRLRHQARVAILPHPLPEDFDFALPAEPDAGPILNPREANEISNVLEDFVPDADVPTIMIAASKALYHWGIVSYDDAFGEVHRTRFCHFYIWYGTEENARPKGYYNRQHNDAT